MDIDVLGRKDTVPDGMRELAHDKVAKLGRLNPVLERAEVRLTEDPEAPLGRRRVCEVIVTGHGHTLRARATARDMLIAVDRVVDKLEHQVERLKGKIVDRSHAKRPFHGDGLTTRTTG